LAEFSTIGKLFVEKGVEMLVKVLSSSSTVGAHFFSRNQLNHVYLLTPALSIAYNPFLTLLNFYQELTIKRL
jgi:hypothetical protein